MTIFAWQLLCRYAKNDGSYHKLIKAIKWCAKNNGNPYFHNVINFISYYEAKNVKCWYKVYYNMKVNQYKYI